MKLGIVAGEASGDILGAGLIKALRELGHTVEVEGVGGPLMTEAGCHNLYDSERLAVMGIIEPLRRLPELIKMRSGLVNHFIQCRPDVFIGIDSPDFNLGLEKKLKKAGIPVIHYVSPSVWAWRKNRIHTIKKAVDRVLTLFPFEKQFYDAHHVPASFVGHPLADQIPLEIDQVNAREKLRLPQQGRLVALLPGSRHHELLYMGETFIKAAEEMRKRDPSIRFITSAVNEARDREFKEMVNRIVPELPIDFYLKESHRVMAAADGVLVASGTATLETLLFKRPMVIVFKTGWLTFQIAKRLVDLPFIGLPNLLANRSLVPEYIQDAAEPIVLADALMQLLDQPEKQQALTQSFAEIHSTMRRQANESAARAVVELITQAEK